MKWYISLCKKSVVRVHLCYGYRAGFLEAELCVKVAKSVESNCSSSQFLQALTSETVRAGNLMAACSTAEQLQESLISPRTIPVLGWSGEIRPSLVVEQQQTD